MSAPVLFETSDHFTQMTAMSGKADKIEVTAEVRFADFFDLHPGSFDPGNRPLAVVQTCRSEGQERAILGHRAFSPSLSRFLSVRYPHADGRFIAANDYEANDGACAGGAKREPDELAAQTFRQLHARRR
jgi:hypothetical protein